MKIKMKEIIYFGYRQGYKVWINGKKFPCQYGAWYTSLNAYEARETAIREAQYEAIVCRKDHTKSSLYY